MKITYCNKCQYHEANFWGYDECWKFDREIDLSVTNHTAARERDVLRLNSNNNCAYFIPKRFKWIRRWTCKHPSVRFVKNLYGQEIENTNGCRSQWECDSCGMPIYKDNFVSKSERKYEQARVGGCVG